MLLFSKNHLQSSTDGKPPHKKYTLASRYKPAHEAKLAREYFFSHPRKIKKQKISHPSKK
jgi:hypothetical protein